MYTDLNVMIWDLGGITEVRDRSLIDPIKELNKLLLF